MHKTWLVVKREYLQRVRSKAFIVFTFLMPALMGALIFLPGKLMSMKSAKSLRVVVVSSNGKLAESLKQELMQPAKTDKTGNKGEAPQNYEVSVVGPPTESLRSELSKKVSSDEIDGYLWLSDDAIASGKIPYATKTATDFMDLNRVEGALRSAKMRTELMKRGLSGSDVDEVSSSISLEPTKLENGKESKSSTGVAIMLPFLMMMMIYITLIIYGIQVMRSVIEEKNSRIVEVLLSSVSASQLMAGKVIGVGAVGLTQMVIWGLCTALVSAAPLIGAASYMKDLQVPPALLFLMPLFFLLGYALYSSIYAAVGAMVNSEEEGQQMQMPIILPLVACTAVTWGVIRQPNSPLAFWLSMFPLTSPIIMFVRASVEMPPLWQLLLSIGILLGTIFLIIQIASRIYRVGILMYGKRPTLPEIIKWIKYA